jgi:hypothetical protein
MVCYAVPLAACLLIHGGKKMLKQDNGKTRRLGLLMSGGAVFGVVDHWWNGELFLVGADPLADIALGMVITVSIAAFWAVLEAFSPAAAAAKA